MTMATTSSSKLLISIAILITFQSPTINASYLYHSCTDSHGNYTTYSTYHTNLNTLLPSLISTTSPIAGFHNSTSIGEIPNRVFADLLCRGDLQIDDCRICLEESRKGLRNNCPNRKAAVIWYQDCVLRYSDVEFAGVMMTKPTFAVWDTQNYTGIYEALNRRVVSLLENLRMMVMAGNYAKGSSNVYEGVFVYSLVQCSPDLSGLDCRDCVVYGIEFLKECCSGSPYVYVGLLSCNVVYSLDNPFFNSTVDVERNQNRSLISTTSQPAPPPQLTSGTSHGKVEKRGNFLIVIIPTIGCVASLLVAIIVLCLYLTMRTTKRKSRTGLPFNSTDEETDDSTQESLQFDIGTIRSATNNFSESNKIGQGGFGAVYRARLFNGQEVAVKRLMKTSESRSNQNDVEFKNEVKFVAQLDHRNLVKLLGFCLEKNERILIYQFMPKSSLNHILFDPYKRVYFDWSQRYKIITGVARGLLYLHEESRLKIIHRDLKAGNVLLDKDMNPKISDFGTARLFADLDQSREKTEKIAGTYGYIAPEYAKNGVFSVKSDVFSFGVLVLEIICGQSIKNFKHGQNLESLLTYAWKSWKKGKPMKLKDPKMRGASKNEILRCVHIGLLCVQEKAVDRPTMGSVVLMLSSYSVSLRIPSRPAYFVHSNLVSDHQVSQNPVSLITQVCPR